MGRDHLHCTYGGYGMPWCSFKLLKGAFAKSSAFSSFGQHCSCTLLKSPSPVLGLKVDVTLHQQQHAQHPGTCLDQFAVLRGSGKAPKLGLGLLDLDRTSGRGSWKDWGDWNDLDVAKVSPGNHRLDGFLPCIFGLTYVLTRVQVTSGSFFVNHHVNHVYEPRNRCVTCNL